jgi:hypothetical protein
MIGQEDQYGFGSGAPLGQMLDSDEKSGALKQLLKQVQAGNDTVIKELLQLFQAQADNQAAIRKALDIAKSSMSNLPL